MESRTLQLLEFDKVLARLAGFAVSEPGREACLELRPFADLDALARAQALLLETVALCAETGCSLGPFIDLGGVFDYLADGRRRLDTDGLWALSDMLEAAEGLREALAAPASGLRPVKKGDVPEAYARPLLAEIATGAPRPVKIRSALKRCLGQDGLLRDQASPELFSVRREIRSIHRSCTSRVKEFVKKESLGPHLQEEFMTISSDRYVLPVRSGSKHRIPGIIHDYSQTGETCYLEPFFLVEVNNRLQELKQEEREEEGRVLLFLTSLAREEQPALAAAYAMLVEMDVLLAKARLGEAFSGTAPGVGQEHAVRLLGAAHPLLALAASSGGDRAVSQDIILKDDQKGLIITGANAGGKTVCLKTLGLISLMVLSGLPVPVEEGSALPFWTKVFVFLGDEQSLEDSLSTFTAQIGNLSRAWPDIDENTLVLLDEFGAGTDPAQGAALAQAVVDGLLERGAFLAAATHFPALKAYGMGKPGVRAACLLFDPASKKPLYRLAYDQVGASIALDVAREHGLPAGILERAEKYLLLEGGDSGAVFDRLNDLAVRRDEEIRALRREREERKKTAAARRRKDEKRREELYEEVRALSRRILREWEEGRLGRKQARKALAGAGKRLIEEKAQDRPQNEADTGTVAPDMSNVAPGDEVTLVSWNKAGRIVEIDPRRKTLKIDMGGVAMQVAPDDVRLGRGGDAVKPASAVVGAGASDRSGSDAGDAGPSMVLDLRGLRAEAAVAELASFLDACLLRGLSGLEIIHGKGTGALRREVHAYLRTAREVASYSLAPEDRGGDGMTMVELK